MTIDVEGLTKNKNIKMTDKEVEKAVKDSFDHWLSSDKENASALIEYVVSRAELRKKRKEEKRRRTERIKLMLLTATRSNHFPHRFLRLHNSRPR